MAIRVARIIGLTGGIGSGKTVVSDYFAELGVPIVDTDVIARQVVEPGQPALQALAHAFGEDILSKDGTLNRNVLREKAFSSAENKKKLDNITHPAIRTETLRQVDDIDSPYGIVVIPLLNSKSSFMDILGRIVVVHSARKVKIQRVKTRSGLTETEVEKIMQTQLSDQESLALADDVIENNSTLEYVENSVQQLHKQYLTLSSKQHQR